MFQNVGLAVFACQSLEIVFALCVKLIYRQADAVQLADIQPLSKNYSKAPTRSLIKELRNYIDINASFKATLDDVIERRHTLIHRWTLESDLGEEGQQRLLRFSFDLAKDATGLTRILIRELYDFMGRFPGLRTELDAMDETWLHSLPERLKGMQIEDQT